MDKYLSTQKDWQKQKLILATESGKNFPEESIIHSNDNYRKKIEIADIVEKS